MKEYTLVIDGTFTRFIERVNEYIRDGWQPLGGVAVGTMSGYVNQLVQAMVREL